MAVEVKGKHFQLFQGGLRRKEGQRNNQCVPGLHRVGQGYSRSMFLLDLSKIGTPEKLTFPLFELAGSKSSTKCA